MSPLNATALFIGPLPTMEAEVPSAPSGRDCPVLPELNISSMVHL